MQGKMSELKLRPTKVRISQDLMAEAPSEVEPEQLEELGIAVRPTEREAALGGAASGAKAPK